MRTSEKMTITSSDFILYSSAFNGTVGFRLWQKINLLPLRYLHPNADIDGLMGLQITRRLSDF